jgi:ribose transport system substrate-binding protein
VTTPIARMGRGRRNLARRPSRRFGTKLAVVAGLIAVTAACSTTSTRSTGSTPAASTSSSGTSTASAANEQILAKGYAGDFQPPPSSGPKAVVGKKVWMISCGQAYYACQQQSLAFQAAGKIIGWSVTIQDGKADPSVAAGLIRQAIAAKIDGVALVTFDCPGIKNALIEAKSAKMPVVNFGSIDCNDPKFGGGQALFSATVKLRGQDNNARFYEEWAKFRADYIIAKSNGTANVLSVGEKSQALHQYQGAAFAQEIATCSGCTNTDVPFAFAQVPSPATQQWLTAIQSHPKANAVAEGIDALMGLGLQTAVEQSGRKNMIVGGGEGFPPNFDLIRSGVQTFSAPYPVGWVMWGVADTLNRVFAGGDPSTFPSQGCGFQYLDAGHNLPAAGQSYVPSFDYQSVYKKIWAGA